MARVSYPVNDEVIVHAGKAIYHTDEWWKAAVLNSYDGEQPGVAIYLWHGDRGWTQKSKYQVRTQEAWESDQSLVDRYVDVGGDKVTEQVAFPVSDYYRITEGETVFKTADWWKAVVKINQKGAYGTEEMIIYLCQKVGDDRRRREKYIIKSESDWDRDRQAVNSPLAEGESGAERVNKNSCHDNLSSHEEGSPSSGNVPTSTAVAGELVPGDVQEEFKRKHIGDRT
jgi:hypothetical protein